jgi:hypothetical protein
MLRKQMKVLVSISVAALIASSPFSGAQSRPDMAIPDGVWTGSLQSETIKADQSKSSGSGEILIAACGGKLQLLVPNEGGSFRRWGEKYTPVSGIDSHLFYFIKAASKQPYWVDTQTYVLLEIDSKSAKFQWSRAVNNRDLDKSAANRYFFTYGTADLKRTSAECDHNLIP